MTARRQLELVAPEPKSAVDLYVNWRAEIRARDWSRVHIAGDRRPPIDLPDGPRRGWRA